MGREQSYFRPFGNDIPRFPKDGDRPAEVAFDLPTKETTMFTDDLGVESARITRGYIDAINNKNRRASIKNVEDFCKDNYPANYQRLRSFLTDQIEIAQQRDDKYTTKPYESLRQHIEEKFEEPKDFRIRVRFDIHTIVNPGEYKKVKEELKEELREVFVKGENNIFFVEDGLGIAANDPYFQMAYRQFGSYRKAIEYSKLLKQLGRQPTDGELESNFRKIRKNCLGNLDIPEYGNRAWGLLQEETVDELLEEGYDIQIEHEQAKGIDVDMEAVNKHAKTYQEFKDNLKYIAEVSRKRDKGILKQINHCVQDAGNQAKKTNLFLLIGAAHKSLISLMPEKLQSVTSTSTFNEETTGKFDAYLKVSEILMEGGNPPEDLWQKAYN